MLLCAEGAKNFINSYFKALNFSSYFEKFWIEVNAKAEGGNLVLERALRGAKGDNCPSAPTAPPLQRARGAIAPFAPLFRHPCQHTVAFS